VDAKSGDQVPAPGEDTPEAPDGATEEMLHLLHEGVPLALLADLASPGGPHSPDILQDEGLPDVAWWGESGREPADDLPDEDEDEDDEAGEGA
jgi:hypothetical protein